MNVVEGGGGNTSDTVIVNGVHLKMDGDLRGSSGGEGLFKTMKPRDLDFFSQCKSKKLFKEKKKIKYFVKYDSKSFITFFLKVQVFREIIYSCPERFQLII